MEVSRRNASSTTPLRESYRGDDQSEKTAKKTDSIATKFFKGLTIAIPFVFATVGAVVGTVFGTPLVGGLAGAAGFLGGAAIAAKIWDCAWPSDKKPEILTDKQEQEAIEYSYI